MIEDPELTSLLEEFHQLFSPPYPWLKVPEYKVGKYGLWTLDQFDESVLIHGYFTGVQPAKHNYRLKKANTIWMSLTPMELESQSHHALAAYGHTVVMGLGMGTLLYNILGREKVTQVTVVERDPDVFDLLHQIASPTSWSGWEKARFVFADALEWKPDEHVDYLTVDIWTKLGDYNLRPDGQRIQANVQANQVALWGQELDFITFVAHQGYEPPPTLEHYREYIEMIGIPLIESDNPSYPSYCMKAGHNALASL
jgi:hypothetical protein